MTKKMVKKTVYTLDRYYIEGTVTDICNRLKTAEKNALDKGYTNIHINVDICYEDNGRQLNVVEFDVVGEILETDAEYNRRIEMERIDKKFKEERDRELLAILKAKYEK